MVSRRCRRRTSESLATLSTQPQQQPSQHMTCHIPQPNPTDTHTDVAGQQWHRQQGGERRVRDAPVRGRCRRLVPLVSAAPRPRAAAAAAPPPPAAAQQPPVHKQQLLSCRGLLRAEQRPRPHAHHHHQYRHATEQFCLLLFLLWHAPAAVFSRAALNPRGAAPSGARSGAGGCPDRQRQQWRGRGRGRGDGARAAAVDVPGVSTGGL